MCFVNYFAFSYGSEINIKFKKLKLKKFNYINLKYCISDCPINILNIVIIIKRQEKTWLKETIKGWIGKRSLIFTFNISYIFRWIFYFFNRIFIRLWVLDWRITTPFDSVTRNQPLFWTFPISNFGPNNPVLRL